MKKGLSGITVSGSPDSNTFAPPPRSRSDLPMEPWSVLQRAPAEGTSVCKDGERDFLSKHDHELQGHEGTD